MQPNPLPNSVVQPVFDLPLGIPQARRTIDPRSPLYEGIQSTPWPANYKSIALPKFNSKFDPHQLNMSLEVAVASTKGNDIVLAKSFVIATEGDALSWYSMLKPSIVYSWENLHDKILANFKGFFSESMMSTDLFQCK